MDNANTWFISVTGADQCIMKSITCIVNSTVFSVLGKSGANPQSGGYFKFNKQFLAPIPFPSGKIQAGNDCVQQLSELYDQVFALQQSYISANPEFREIYAQSLKMKWDEMDDICFSLYEVDEDDRRQICAIGRTVDRVGLLGGIN